MEKKTHLQSLRPGSKTGAVLGINFVQCETIIMEVERRYLDKCLLEVYQIFKLESSLVEC